MRSVVHGVSIQNCQWTGEPIVKKRFRIPIKGLRVWKGCYGSPSTALAGLADYAQKEKLEAEVQHELIDAFEASLRRAAGFEKEKFTITVAPSFKFLKMWGGKMSIDEYHDMYKHDQQVDMYEQYIPDKSLDNTVAEDLEELKRRKMAEDETFEDMEECVEERQNPPNAPKMWYTTENGKEVGEKQMPRGVTSVLQFIREQNDGICPGNPHMALLYLHPLSNKCFGIGKLHEWESNARVSRWASEALGHTVVFGNPRLFHKNKLRTRQAIKRRLSDTNKTNK